MTRTKIALLIGILLGTVSAFAQEAPLKLIVINGNLVAANTSTKGVIAFYVHFAAPKVDGDYGHDWYSKPHVGIMPTESLNLTSDMPGGVAGAVTSGELLFVQMDDGSTWGDVASEPAKSIFEDIKKNRVELKKFLQSVLDSGEAALLDRLNSEPEDSAFWGTAQDLLRRQKQLGTQDTMKAVRSRLATMNARTF